MKTFCLIASCVLLLLVNSPVFADETRTLSEVQVDGILSSVVDPLWAQSDEYFHDGDYPRIIALERIITEIDPHFIDAYNTGAWIMWSIGRDADAEAYYQENMHNNPSDPEAYYDYGFFLYNHTHNYDEAIKVFKQDIEAGNGGILDYRMLAHSYERKNEWSNALEIWRRIKAKWPNGPANDPTKGAVDDHNLLRTARHIAPITVPMTPVK